MTVRRSATVRITMLTRACRRDVRQRSARYNNVGEAAVSRRGRILVDMVPNLDLTSFACPLHQICERTRSLSVLNAAETKHEI